MLCQDVKNIIFEFAADRQFYVLLEDFSNQIEVLVNIKNTELTSHKFENLCTGERTIGTRKH